MKPSLPKTHLELIESWDQLARERHRQIQSGDDLSFHHIIVPMALELLDGCEKTVTLEIGSGTGEFTGRLAQISGQVLAAEPSPVSLQLARENCRSHKNVQFFESPIENTTDELVDSKVTCSVALMSLMTAPDLYAIVRSLNTILPPFSRFVAVFTHPCFWPKYRGYHDKGWFNYKKEIFIEAPFTISKCATDILTTHIHRPLEHYLSAFSSSGFCLETLVEPVPSAEIQILYPEPWRFPRFIGLKWLKCPTPTHTRFIHAGSDNVEASVT